MSKGFTFVEIIVVIAIIGIMTAVGVGSYSNQAQNQQLKAEAERFADDMAVARQMTLNRDTSGTVCDLTGFQIVVNRASHWYTVTRLCKGLADVEVKRVIFQSSLVFTNPCCTFTVAYPYASIAPTLQTFRLQHKGNRNKCIPITVDAYRPVQIGDIISCT